MWCAACQLDAPALAVPEEPGIIRCAFCHGELAGSGQGPAAKVPVSETRGEDSDDPEPLLAFVPPPAIDDWECDTELHRVERLVRVLRHAHERGESLRMADKGLRNDEHPVAAAIPPTAIPPPQAAPAGLAAWACLTLGLMAFVCGGVLVGWSFVTDRGDLWSLGLPLSLGGQVGLVLGLLLQLDGLSQSTRRTEQTLTDLGGRLGELREVTALVSATHSAPAHSFYAHLSEGASPQILLADLKGQLDLLAQQMARQRKAA